MPGDRALVAIHASRGAGSLVLGRYLRSCLIKSFLFSTCLGKPPFFGTGVADKALWPTCVRFSLRYLIS
jgi:hypothetical protein